MVPVSTRQADQRGALGNQVAMWLVNLPVSEPEPFRRLQMVHQETMRLKKTNQALGAATLVELSRGTPLTLISVANRVVGPMMRPFNLTVTNVPGPQFPMYLLEAKMIASYPDRAALVPARPRTGDLLIRRNPSLGHPCRLRCHSRHRSSRSRDHSAIDELRKLLGGSASDRASGQ